MINLSKKISQRRWRLSQATHTLLLMLLLSSILSRSQRLSIPNQSQNLSQSHTTLLQPTMSQFTTSQSTNLTTADTLTHLKLSTPSTMIPSMQTCTQPKLHHILTSLVHTTTNQSTNLTYHMCHTTQNQNQSCHTTQNQNQSCHTTQNQSRNQSQNLSTFQNLSQSYHMYHTTQNQSQKKFAVAKSKKIKSSNSSGKKHSYMKRSRPLWDKSKTSKIN